MSIDFVRHSIEHQLWMRIRARPLYLGSMTTAQRNLLPTLNGMTIYNSTTNQYEFLEAGVWRTFSPAYVPPGFAVPVDVGTANAAGVAPTLVRSDHVHRGQLASGTLATRPAAGIADSYYWATDLGVLFRDTGVAWEVVPNYYARYLSNLHMLNIQVGGSQPFGLAGRVFLAPIQISHTITIDRLGYSLGTTTAGNIRLGLYHVGSFGWPDLPDTGTLVCESGSVAQAGLGANRYHFATVPTTTLVPGLYFQAIQGDDATGQYRGGIAGWSHNVDGNVNFVRFFNQAYGAFTDPCPTPTTTTAAYHPMWYMRVSAIP